MTWARVLQIYAILIVLAGYLFILDPSPSDVDPKNVPPPMEESLLQAAPEAIVSLTVRRKAEEVHAVAANGRWQVLRPTEADVPSDLLSAIVGTLTAGQASEVLAATSGPDLVEFGLVEPSAEIQIGFGEGRDAIRVELGAQNPTGTAVLRPSQRSRYRLSGWDERQVLPRPRPRGHTRRRLTRARGRVSRPRVTMRRTAPVPHCVRRLRGRPDAPGRDTCARILSASPRACRLRAARRRPDAREHSPA